jgi:hypothetical protein
MKTRLFLLVFLLSVCSIMTTSNRSFAGDAHPENELLESELTISRLSECIASRLSLEAVVLIDESVSLVSTDKDDERVSLAQDIVSALGGISSSDVDGVSPRVDLLVAGFGSDLASLSGSPTTNSDWITLSQDATKDVLDQLQGFADRDDDRDTDYVDALQRANRLLGEHATSMQKEMDSAPCRLIVWFTDGKFDIERASTPRDWAPSETDPAVAEAIGRDILCRDEGVAHSLRMQETFLLTVGLDSDLFGPKEAELLRGITLGERCGRASAEGWGWYRLGGDFVELRTCLFLALNGFPCPPQPPGQSCSTSNECAESFEVFPTDGSITGVVWSTSGEGAIELRAPDGDMISIEAATPVDIGGATVSVTGRNGLYNFLLRPMNGSDLAYGTWTFSLNSEKTTDLELRFRRTPVVRFEVRGPTTSPIGEELEFDVSLIDKDGRPATLAPDTSAEFVVEVSDGAEAVEKVLPADFSVGSDGEASFTIHLNNQSIGSVTLNVRGNVIVDEGGETLSYPMPSVEQVIRLINPGLPSISVGRIDFGYLEAKFRAKSDWESSEIPEYEPLSGRAEIVDVVGPSTGDGIVCWLGVGSITDLEASDPVVRLSGATPYGDFEQCAAVGENEKRSLVFELEVGQLVSGSLSGSGQLALVNSTTGDQETAAVEFGAQIEVPHPPMSRDAKLVIGLLLLALGIPLAVHLLLSILLAVLWRIRHCRRVWSFEFSGLTSHGVRKIAELREAQGEFITDSGGIFGPWRAVHHQTGLVLRARPSILGSPKITVSAASLNASSGVLAVSARAKLSDSVSRLWSRVRRLDRDARPNWDRAVIGQPVSHQWFIVGLRKAGDRSLSGQLLIIGRPEDLQGQTANSVSVDARARDILRYEVRDRFQSLYDSLD